MERAVITSSILASAYVIVHGYDVAGTILGGGTLVGLVGTFVYGTNSRRHERLDREKLLTDTPDPRLGRTFQPFPAPQSRKYGFLCHCGLGMLML